MYRYKQKKKTKNKFSSIWVNLELGTAWVKSYKFNIINSWLILTS